MSKKKENTTRPAEFGGNNPVLSNVVAPLALLLILLATATPFFLMHQPWAQQVYPFVYLAGAVILLAARLFNRRHTTDLRLRALYRLETWSPVVFLAGIAIFFYNYNSGELRDWIAFTMAGAFLQAYASIAIPAREKKIREQQTD